MSFAEAAGLPLAALTAYRGVVHALGVRQGESVLVLGAAGGVGSVAVQIAMARGARVIRAGSVDDHAYVRRALGAEAVAYGEGLTERVLDLVPTGVDAVLDTIGGGALAASAGAVRPGGRLASIAEPGVPGSTDVFARMDRADLTAVTALAEAGRAGSRRAWARSSLWRRPRRLNPPSSAATSLARSSSKSDESRAMVPPDRPQRAPVLVRQWMATRRGKFPEIP
ncbi:zinc-binding dehydrogenase [Streptomyces sp. Agncl-13]|uniref:zinc-binding dehydrogenase n=1 Tax=Streptomyces sp. Agncl-13 TaxID=3400628 RepID=UPI003A8806F3